MATPINFQPMPLSQSCFNGVVTMGAPVAQMALTLKQLNQVKFRSAGYYHVGRSTWQDWNSINYAKGATFGGYQNIPTKGYLDEFDLFYFSLPTSQWIGIEIIYGAASSNPTSLDGPYILADLYEISGGAISTKIDEGILFTYPEQLQILERGQLTGLARVNTGSRLYDFPSGGLSAPTFPRPLYIPPSNRGDELVVKIEAREVIIYAVHLFDIFMEA